MFNFCRKSYRINSLQISFCWTYRTYIMWDVSEDRCRGYPVIVASIAAKLPGTSPEWYTGYTVRL